MMLDLLSLKERDQIAVENALPAHMMFLMMEQCMKIGLELRADVLHKLNVASAAPLSKLDNFSVARLAKRIDDLAKNLLTGLNASDPRDGLYCCVMFTLHLVDEGWLQDQGNMAVLVALLLMDDIKDDSKDARGEGTVWKLDERKWRIAAGGMHVRAALQGVFNTRRK